MGSGRSTCIWVRGSFRFGDSFGSEVPVDMVILEQGVEVIAFSGRFLWKHCGSVCDGLWKLIMSYLNPFPSSSSLSTLTGLVAHGVLWLIVDGSLSISSAIMWVLPVPAAQKMRALMSLASTYSCVIASSHISLDFSLAVWWENDTNFICKVLCEESGLYCVRSDHNPSGGFRNLERGVQPLAREALPKILGLPRPLSVNVRTEYLEVTPGLVKRLEISKEHIRECVTAWLLLLHFTAV